jgi:hypothetical protein
MRKASKDAIAFMDDDDEYANDALHLMRSAAGGTRAISIFRMWHRSEGVIWKERVVKCGNVSSQMILIPNEQHRLAVWPELYEGDFWFIRRTIDNWPGGEQAIAWQDPVIALHHPTPERFGSGR